jgi:hypothetical protein
VLIFIPGLSVISNVDAVTGDITSKILEAIIGAHDPPQGL